MLDNRIVRNGMRLFFIFLSSVISIKVIFYDVLFIDKMMAQFVSSIRCDEMDFFMKFVTSFRNTATIFILLCLCR